MASLPMPQKVLVAKTPKSTPAPAPAQTASDLWCFSLSASARWLVAATSSNRVSGWLAFTSKGLQTTEEQVGRAEFPLYCDLTENLQSGCPKDTCKGICDKLVPLVWVGHATADSMVSEAVLRLSTG